MDLSYLYTYIEVVKSGSISKAARKLSLSQPAVSIQVKKIEQELGIRLIDRDRNYFKITEGGKSYFRFAEYVSHAYKKLLYDISFIDKKINRKIVILSDPLGESFLPRLINDFREYNPYTEIALFITETAKIVVELPKEVNSIGISGTALSIPGFSSFQILEDRLVAAVSSSHPFADEKSITMSDLQGQTILMRQEFSFFSQALAKAGFDINNHSPKVILGSTVGLLEAIESNLGISFLPRLAIRKQEASGSIKVVEIDNFKLYWKLYCIYSEDALNHTENNAFIDFLKKRFLIPVKVI